MKRDITIAAVLALVFIIFLLFLSFANIGEAAEFKVEKPIYSNVKKWELPELKLNVGEFSAEYKWTKLELNFKELNLTAGINKKFDPKVELTYTLWRW